MKTKDKLKVERLFCIVTVFALACLFLFGCNKDTVDNYNENNGTAEGLSSVTFYNVGEADCCFIKFPDGKTMLIDAGEKDVSTERRLKSDISSSGGKVNYLLLTHPHLDHIGNALEIVKSFSVGRAFLPFINDLSPFPVYKEIYETLIKNKTEITTSQIFTEIKGEDYYIKFLSPMPYGNKESSYNAVNLSEEITDTMINNISPIVYVNICGVRFVFTGDAGTSQERIVLENYKLGLYNVGISFADKEYVDLDSVDFFKVSHHGASEGLSDSFANTLKPENAVISVGGDNIFGHPHDDTIEKLVQANENTAILRTDIAGEINVYINKQGKYSVTCGKNI